MGSRAELHELNASLNEERHEPNSTLKVEAPRVSENLRFPISAQKAHISRPASAKLFRQTYLLSLVSLYSCLSIIAWTIICVQTKRPITTHTYSYVPYADDHHCVLANRMKRNAEWFRAAKVLLAITNTLIVPLTSTVCASAAVIYVQNYGRRRHFSMQHTATLADRGWSSPQVWLALLSIDGWKSQGSYFLVFAMGFHALGLLNAPLQQYYIGQETFKFQTVQAAGIAGATDVLNLFQDSPVGNNPKLTARLRNELASVSHNDFQPNIWQEGASHCSSNSSNGFSVSPECHQGGVTFDSFAALQSPYVAQLPAGYQTGLMTQIMPRMNSSVSLIHVSRTAFPSNCNATSGAYYIEHTYNTTVLNVQVCASSVFDFDPLENITLKLTVNTTLGYFELPNYNNSGIAGPLLAKDPYETCRGDNHQCLSQWQSKRSLQTNESSTSFAIGVTANIGPLAMIVAAMFEPGSFIATRTPQNGAPPPDLWLPGSGPAIPCTVPPLNLLLDEPAGDVQCSTPPFYADDGYESITDWLKLFYDTSTMQNALHAAAALASQVWLSSVDGSLTVYYDMGQDSVRPKISSAGVILLSILLAIVLLVLLIVATYISFSYTWVGNFDSSAMMRPGAARADELPLQVISSEGKEKTRTLLKRMPGWVGDARPDDEVGAVAVGATVPLKAGRRYQAPEAYKSETLGLNAKLEMCFATQFMRTTGGGLQRSVRGEAY